MTDKDAFRNSFHTASVPTPTGKFKGSFSNDNLKITSSSAASSHGSRNVSVPFKRMVSRCIEAEGLQYLVN